MRVCLFLLSLGIVTMSLLPAADFPPPPPTKRIEQTDDYHGIRVADPFRWLEDEVRESQDVAAWVEGPKQSDRGVSRDGAAA